MSDDDPSTTLEGETVMESDKDVTENMESVTEQVSVSLNDSKIEEPPKKKRKSVKKRSDGYKSRKRTKSTKSAKSATTASDEYEVEMIIDHKTDEEVNLNFFVGPHYFFNVEN